MESSHWTANVSVSMHLEDKTGGDTRGWQRVYSEYNACNRRESVRVRECESEREMERGGKGREGEPDEMSHPTVSNGGWRTPRQDHLE